MYTQHFSLHSLPFENVSDPAFFFDQGDYGRVLHRLTESLHGGKGLMVVVGPIGSGKTTLSQKLIVSTPDKTKLIWLDEPPDSSEDLLLFLTQELHIIPESTGRVFLLRDIRECLIKLQGEGNRYLLIIDEVHKISDDVLESVRLLNNLELGGTKLIQILLIGQEEFLDIFSQPSYESFKQRIATLDNIGRMTPVQTREYILHRLKIAGSISSIFTEDAIEIIASTSRGTPRLVNTFCDLALRFGYESNKSIVDPDCVRLAADEIGLGSEVLWWLIERENEKMAQNVMPQTSYLEVQDNTQEAVAEPTNKETKPNKKIIPARSHADDSSWLFPILLLCVSILMFSGSLWFFQMKWAQSFGDSLVLKETPSAVRQGERSVGE